MKNFVKIITYSFLTLFGITLASCGETSNSEHIHDYKAVITPATCETKGYTTYICDCSDSYISDEVSALGHNWDEGSVTKEASCTSEGNTHYICLNDSSHTKDEPISKKDHSIVKHDETESTCVVAGNIEYYSCEYCDTYFSDAEGKNIIEDKTSVLKDLSSEHNIGNWQIESASYGGVATIVRGCQEEGCNEKEYSTNNIPSIYSHVIDNTIELESLFDVTYKNDYSFEFKQGVLTNTNQLVASSEAKITFTAISNGTITFNSEVHSEYDRDYLKITKNDIEIYNSKSYATSDEEKVINTHSIDVVEGDVITFIKFTDSSDWGIDNEKNVDYAKLSNIRFISSVAPINPEFVMISFETTGGEKLNPIVAMKNQPVDYLPIPVREEYEFENWYLDAACTNAFNIASGSNDNVTLYANWVASSEAFVGRGTYYGYQVGYYDIVRNDLVSVSMDIYGNIFGYIQGKIENYDVNSGKITYKDSSKNTKYMYYDSISNVLAFPEDTNESTLGNFIYILVKDSKNPTISMSAFSSDTSTLSMKLVQVNDTLVFIKDSKIYPNVTYNSILEENLTVKKAYEAKDIMVKDAYGNVLLAKGYNEELEKMVDLDSVYGIYSKDNDTVIFDGQGNVTLNENKGTYSILDNGIVEAIVNNTCYHYELDGNSYNVTIPTVEITFITPDGFDDVDPISYNINIKANLPVLSKEGFVFNGWFFDEAYTEAVPETFTPTVSDTLYAKFSNAIKLTIVYNSNQETKEIAYSENEVVSIARPEYSKHAFINWYTTPTFDEGSEWSGNNQAINESITIYAKWEKAPIYNNVYIPTEIESKDDYPVTGTSSSYSWTGAVADIDPYGYAIDPQASPFKNGDLMVKNYNKEEGTIELYVGTIVYKGFVDDKSGIIILNATAGLNANFTNVYLMSPFETTSIISKIKSSYWSNGKDRAIQYTYNNKVYSIFVHNNKVYFDVYFLDSLTNAMDVEANECYTSQYLYVYDKNDDLIAKYGHNGECLVELDGYEGTYSNGSDTVKLNGVDTITLNGTNGTYQIIKENVIGANVNNYYYEITLEGTSCVVSKPMVEISFDTNGGEKVDSISVNANVETTLPIPTREGYVFKGWTVEGNNVGTTYTPTEEVTFVAVWNEAFKVTLVNNNETKDVTLVVENGTDIVDHVDYVEPTKEGYVFNGWYYDKEFTEAYTGIVTKDTILYANWMENPSFIGTYNGVEVWGTSDGGTGSYSTKKTLTINETFYINGGKSGQINIDSYDSTTGTMTYSSSNYMVMYSKQNKYEFFIINYSASATDPINGTDYYVYVKTDVACTGSNSNQYVWSKGYERVFAMTFGSETVIIYINANDNTFYGNITLEDLSGNKVEATNTGLKTATSLVIKDVNGNILKEFAKDGSNFIGLDGYQDVEYVGDLGTIVLDGAGNATVGETLTTYIVESENTISFVYNGMTKVVVVDKANASYALITDGSVGTYKNDTNTFVSNGDGTCTYNGVAGTYTINGSNVTYTVNGETSTIALKEDGTYATKSPFAGYTFTGTFYDTWWETNSSLKFVFNDSPEIIGTMYAGSGNFDFEGVLDGETLLLTIVKAFGKTNDSNVGKTVTITVSGSTLIVADTTISQSGYIVDNNGSATCEGFSL